VRKTETQLQTEDQYELLSVKYNKNKSDIKKLSEKVDIVNNSNYGLNIMLRIEVTLVFSSASSTTFLLCCSSLRLSLSDITITEQQ
jgi:hypothetical protein